jgi:hypothetical protein
MVGAGLSFRFLVTDGLVESEAWRMPASAEATTRRCIRQQLRRSTVGEFFGSNGVCESEEADGLAWVLGCSSRTRRGPIALLSERAKAAPHAPGSVPFHAVMALCVWPQGATRGRNHIGVNVEVSIRGRRASVYCV